MEDICKELDNSIVYAMSLSSKELFHSNVFAWLLEHDPKYVKIFFEDFNYKEKEYEVKREWHNRDIVILVENDKKFYQIENKFKSIPSIKQLEEYTPKKDKKVEKYTLAKSVLVSLVNPFEEDSKIINANTWTYLDYDYIVKKIEEILDKSEKDAKNKVIIQEYCNILKSINSLLKNDLNKNIDKLDYDYNSKLSDLRLDDVFKKLKANKFLDWLRKKDNISNNNKNYFGIDPTDITSDGRYHWSVFQSFHHSKASIEIRFSSYSDVNKDNYKLIGIEIEENNYRYVVEENYKNNKIDDIFEKYSNEYDGGLKWLNKNLESKKKYNKYVVENKYFNIYQHQNIKDDELKFENLYEKIKNDMLKAKIIITAIENVNNQ